MGNLEQKCVRPGYWRIEGYDVVRIARPDCKLRAAWEIRHLGARQAEYLTLTECRGWIADQPGVSSDWIGQ